MSPNNENEWREHLTDEQYRILRKGETEAPFTGEYHDSKDEGVYRCAGCGNILFQSDAKYNSGTGWPSFTQPMAESAIGKRMDNTLGMTRTEVFCNKCGGHLGHVFDDGPGPTKKRYCINSCALELEEKKMEN